MIGGASTIVVLGEHLEELALAAKRYTLEELLILSSAVSSELAKAKLGSLSTVDFDYIFSDSVSFTNAEMNYIFSNSGGSNAFATEEVNYIFSNGGTSSNAFTESEIGYIFN